MQQQNEYVKQTKSGNNKNKTEKKRYEKRQMMMMMPLYNYLKRLQNNMPEKEMVSDDLKLLFRSVLCVCSNANTHRNNNEMLTYNNGYNSKKKPLSIFEVLRSYFS